MPIWLLAVGALALVGLSRGRAPGAPASSQMVTVTTGPKKKKPAQPPLEEVGDCSSLWPPSKALDCLESIKKIIPSSGPASSPAAQGCGSKPPLPSNWKELPYSDPRRVKYRAWYKCKQGS